MTRHSPSPRATRRLMVCGLSVGKGGLSIEDIVSIRYQPTLPWTFAWRASCPFSCMISTSEDTVQTKREKLVPALWTCR